MKLFLIIAITMLYFGISDGGFIGSAIGGAIGGYVGSSGSSSPNASVQEPAPPVSDQNIAIIELCEAIYSSEVSYDLSCGKIKVRHGGQGCSRYTYEYVSVGHYVKSIYPNGEFERLSPESRFALGENEMLTFNTRK